MHGGALNINTLTAIAIIFAAIVVAFDRFGLLERLGVVKPKATEALDELQLSDRKVLRLQDEIAELRAQKVQLEQEALSPILELMKTNAELNAQVLQRLKHHNGSFAHMEETMHFVAEGMKALVGTIAELHDIPLKPITPPPARRRRRT